MHKIHANMYFLYVELMSFFIQLGNLFKLYSFFYNIPKSYMNTKHTKFYHIIHIIVPFNSDTNAMYQFVIIFFSSLKRPQISFKSSPFISFVQFLELRVIPHPIKILLAKGETRKWIYSDKMLFFSMESLSSSRILFPFSILESYVFFTFSHIFHYHFHYSMIQWKISSINVNKVARKIILILDLFYLLEKIIYIEWVSLFFFYSCIDFKYILKFVRK